MSTSEHWYVIRDGKLYYHYENDGVAILRKGIDPHEKLIGNARS